MCSIRTFFPPGSNQIQKKSECTSTISRHILSCKRQLHHYFYPLFKANSFECAGICSLTRNGLHLRCISIASSLDCISIATSLHCISKPRKDQMKVKKIIPEKNLKANLSLKNKVFYLYVIVPDQTKRDRDRQPDKYAHKQRFAFVHLATNAPKIILKTLARIYRSNGIIDSVLFWRTCSSFDASAINCNALSFAV